MNPVKDNKLHLGGNAGFGAIYLSSQSSIVASNQISSFTIVPDFGIDIKVQSPNTLVIGTTSKTHALNRITVNSTISYNFDSTFNALNLETIGNLALLQTDSNSLQITSNSFSEIVTSDGTTIDSGLTGGLLGGLGKLLGFTPMAEGGIVSKPTFAMVGEGGESEAVMPLSKLDSILSSAFTSGANSGGGMTGGSFVLRGNDLVLAMQRSNSSLNLRRGGI